LGMFTCPDQRCARGFFTKTMASTGGERSDAGWSLVDDRREKSRKDKAKDESERAVKGPGHASPQNGGRGRGSVKEILKRPQTAGGRGSGEGQQQEKSDGRGRGRGQQRPMSAAAGGAGAGRGDGGGPEPVSNTAASRKAGGRGRGGNEERPEGGKSLRDGEQKAGGRPGQSLGRGDFGGGKPLPHQQAKKNAGVIGRDNSSINSSSNNGGASSNFAAEASFGMGEPPIPRYIML